MKVYEQANDIIVREMTEDDLERFLEFMMERGTIEDFTVDDIRILWKFRNKKGDVQCTITSTDSKTIYGFCGMLRSGSGAYSETIGFFEKYNSENYKRQAKEIMLRLSLGMVFDILHT